MGETMKVAGLGTSARLPLTGKGCGRYAVKVPAKFYEDLVKADWSVREPKGDSWLSVVACTRDSRKYGQKSDIRNGTKLHLAIARMAGLDVTGCRKVWFHNGNPLDVRLENMETVTRAEWLRRKRKVAKEIRGGTDSYDFVGRGGVKLAKPARTTEKPPKKRRRKRRSRAKAGGEADLACGQRDKQKSRKVAKAARRRKAKLRRDAAKAQRRVNKMAERGVKIPDTVDFRSDLS